MIYCCTVGKRASKCACGATVDFTHETHMTPTYFGAGTLYR